MLIGCKNISSNNTSDLDGINKNQIVNQALIDSLMKVSHNRGIFNGNIIVVKDKGIIYQNEFGYSDASNSKKLSQNSIFNIDSIAKEFNAVALIRMN